MATLQQSAKQHCIEAIRSGDFDPWLKEIAKEAFIRAEAIGQVVGKTKATPPASSQPGHWPVNPISSTNPDAKFLYNGLHWRRSDFVGHKFFVQPGTYKNSTYDGLRGVITGAGDKMLRVTFKAEDNPNRALPSGVDNNRGEVIFIRYKKVAYLFNMNRGSQ